MRRTLLSTLRPAWLRMAATALLSLTLLAACDMMEDDLSDCPKGLYVGFKYDYNLQRADMFADHVGSVTLYIFDEDGRLVRTQEESNSVDARPLAAPGYRMHVEGLAPGNYRLLALAGQKPYADMLTSGRARFVRSDMTEGSDIKSLSILLDRQADGDSLYTVDNHGLPLDTLWHGLLSEPVTVYAADRNCPTYATVSLVRDTKHILVSLRELDDPTQMDIDHYDVRIIDHNSHILWDNSLDESDAVVYTPYATWNTDDRTPATSADGSQLSGVGRIGHADLMTSRILYHDDPADDGVLLVTDRRTGASVATLNLPDVLSRLRSSDELHLYTPQEFLDRGYDYTLELFLKGGRLNAVDISISVLGWSKRLQLADL